MIGVLGCGNMAQAIVKGLHHNFKNLDFLTFTPSKVRAEELAQKVSGQVMMELSDVNKCEIVLIGCKPQQFNELADQLQKVISNKKIHFVSMMAAIDLDTLSKKLGTNNITRIMPNTPILLGQGVTLMTHHSSVQQENRTQLEDLFKTIGSLYLLDDEEMFDKVMTVTGCGPAYVFLFAQTLIEKLQDWGMDAKSAKEMTINMFSGSVAMMKHSPEDISSLISQVTSKGGTTIEAVKVYQENKLGLITSHALDAALRRSHELTKEFSK